MRALASNLRFPEGPIALTDGSVLVVEIESRKLTQVGADGAVRTVATFEGGPNGAAIGPDGSCYVCNNGGFSWTEDAHGLRPSGQASDYGGGRIERVDLVTGSVETLYTHSDRAPLKGPNDIVFDAHGGFFFTDRGKVRDRDEDRGALCYALPDGSHIKEVAFPLISPNGVGLSPDGQTLYVAETETARLWGFDLIGPGEVRRADWPSPHGGRFIANASGYRRFDSLAVDSAGNICVATLIDGGITLIAPDGSGVRHIPFGDPYTTNICFGGDDLRTAYVTLSGAGLLVACEWERAGLPLHFLNT